MFVDSWEGLPARGPGVLCDEDLRALSGVLFGAGTHADTHVASFNVVLDEFARAVTEVGPLNVPGHDAELSIGNVRYGVPCLPFLSQATCTARHAMAHKETYSVPVFADVTVLHPQTRVPIQTVNQCFLTRLPIVQGCKVDPEGLTSHSGAFVCKTTSGILHLATMATNTLLVFPSKDPSVLATGEIRCTHPDKRRNTSSLNWNYCTGPAGRTFMLEQSYVRNNKQNANPFPLKALLRALNVPDDEAIAHVHALAPALPMHFVRELFLQHSEMDDWDEEDAMAWIKSLTREDPDSMTAQTRRSAVHDMRRLIESEILPGMSDESKIVMLLRIVAHTLVVYHTNSGWNNRDDFINKHFDVSCMRFGPYVRMEWRKAVHRLRQDIAVRLQQKTSALRTESGPIMPQLYSMLVNALRRGVLTERKEQSGDATEIVPHDSGYRFAAARASNSTSGIVPMEARQLNTSAWVVACPFETPDGQKCGTRIALALGARLTTQVHCQAALVAAVCMAPSVVPLNPAAPQTLVQVNHEIAGQCARGSEDEVYRQLAELRDQQLLPLDCQLYVTVQGIPVVHVSTELGTPLRPLVRNECASIVRVQALLRSGCGHSVSVAQRLEDGGDLVWRSVREMAYLQRRGVAVADTLLRAHRGKFGFVDAYCFASLGAVGALVPFAEHNQSPRLVLTAGMLKQAAMSLAYERALRMGVGEVDLMTESVTYSLHQPQRAIVSTTSDVVQSMPPFVGTPLVGVLSPDGGCVEDGIVVKRSMASHLTVEKTHRLHFTVDRTDQMSNDPSVINGWQLLRHGSRKSLRAETGLPAVGARVDFGDIVVGRARQVPDRQIGEGMGSARVNQYIDESVRWKSGVSVVRSVRVAVNPDTRVEQVTVILGETLFMGLGDKFAPRNGQKGVIVEVWPDEDMPFDDSGMSLDFIFSSVAVLGRMTVGMLLEAQAGMLALEHGKSVNGTPFQLSVDPCRPEQIEAMFKHAGMPVQDTLFSVSRSATRRHFVDGRSGEALAGLVWCGFVSYMALARHHPAHKVHARRTGQCNPMTGLPPKGKAVLGGQRFGEMERDAISTNGCAGLTKERLAQKTLPVLICRHCKQMAMPGSSAYVSTRTQASAHCRVCNLPPRNLPIDVVQVDMPQPTRFITQELMGANIGVRFDTELCMEA